MVDTFVFYSLRSLCVLNALLAPLWFIKCHLIVEINLLELELGDFGASDDFLTNFAVITPPNDDPRICAIFY